MFVKVLTPRRRLAQRRRPRQLSAERLEPRAVLSVATVSATFKLVPDVESPFVASTQFHGAPPAIAAVVPAPTAAPPAFVATAVRAAVPTGPIVHTVASPFQRTATRIRVLLPNGYDSARTYRTIYVLPVEAGNSAQYGDGLRVVQQANLHNIHQTIFVAPSFSDMPWYANHVSNVRMRQESHLIDFVIPFVEQRYAVSRRGADRLLLGFSKSGYGAFSMLLRNPETFGKAFAWDSPVGMGNPATGWDFLKILGSRSNFENYRITSLLSKKAPLFAQQPPRLFLAGYSYGFTRSDHVRVAALMTSLRVPHVYDPGRYRTHVWQSGWVPGAVATLLS